MDTFTSSFLDIKQDKRSLQSQALYNQILKLKKERDEDCLTDWNHNQIS